MTMSTSRRTISKLLVANRAEIAGRIFTTARAMGMRTVAVHSDADAALPYVRAADEAVRLPGTAPSDTYLRVDLLIDAARRTGADGLHPGYGFLSERAELARACAAAGIVFVGPSPEAIDAMGSKVEAKRIMATAGVPVLPGLTIEPGAPLPDRDVVAAEVGVPILVKAAFGGGGRGMRIARDPSELTDAVTSAQREAESAFGDGTVFLERYVQQPRHVEVQIFGDHHGTVVHLFERECSIQRRHQKIVEEAPSPAVDDALRARLTDAAVTAGRAIGYANAGTVEFVLEPDGRFWFLEVNTRLQVEHRVTEAITGLDLVELQLRVAQGEAIPAAVLDARICGHAIEARLYAEDVAAGYLPVSGRVHTLHISRDVRSDVGYDDGSVVSPYYDAMLAKVVAAAPTRQETAAQLANALDRARIHGIATNRDLLVTILRSSEFLAGATDTGFLDRRAYTPPAVDGEARRFHAVAAWLADRARRARQSPVPAGIPPAFRTVGPAEQPFVLDDGSVRTALVARDTRARTLVEHDGEVLDVTASRALGDGAWSIVVAGRTVHCDVHLAGEHLHVDSALGHSSFRVVERFPLPQPADDAGSLHSPMPGAVVRVAVAPGDAVATGSVLLTLEAMKMEHAVRAPHDGVVREVRVHAGDQVEAGTVLVVLDVDTT